MKRLAHISVVFLLALGMSSCAKEELESPNITPEPEAIMNSGVQSIDATIQLESIGDKPSPVQINDDGDNEEEGTTMGNSGGNNDPKQK